MDALQQSRRYGSEDLYMEKSRWAESKVKPITAESQVQTLRPK